MSGNINFSSKYKYDTVCFGRLLSFLIIFQLLVLLDLLCAVSQLLKPFEERRREEGEEERSGEEERRGLVTMYHVFY